MGNPFFSDVSSRTSSAVTPALRPSPDQGGLPTPPRLSGDRAQAPAPAAQPNRLQLLHMLHSAGGGREGDKAQGNWGAGGGAVGGIEVRKMVVRGAWRLGRRAGEQ